jgi:uncharacterized SAM-binding protein YcdF (DUF218 family)
MTAPLSDRERFLASFPVQPRRDGHAIVVLCGEDVEPRLEAAWALFQLGAAPQIVLSGGRHEPPRIIGAEVCEGRMLGLGVAPDRIVREAESRNTHEQAEHIMTLAAARQWSRLLLVASAYHAARAYLTFLRALQVRGATETVRLIPVPVASPWGESPIAVEQDRWTLLDHETAKIEAYAARGHVASYADGLAYLRWWETRP